MTAIRETFEETGLLLASATTESESPSPSPSLSEATLEASRESIHTGRTLFRDFLKQHALSADVNTLLPFTEWVTPLGYSRCVRERAPFLLSHSFTHSHNQHANTGNCNRTQSHTAASTRVSTSLSCPLRLFAPRPPWTSHHFRPSLE